ncbi:MAG: glycosyltransferase [Limisphaerales bacterium]
MKPSIALVINTYQQPEYLGRVLRAVSAQTDAPDEIWVAEDDTDPATAKAFTSWKESSRAASPGHVRQEHNGFRRSSILNEAIARAKADYIVFLDGDTIPHPQFISDHRALAQPGTFVQGHRALIEKKAAAYFGLQNFASDRRKALVSFQLRGLKHAYRWPAPLKRTRSDLHGIRGCNLGIWRADLLKVNGYNEAFVGWGREDSELAVRLMNSGIQRVDVRGRALCYHLWHPAASRAGLATNDDLLQKAIDTNARRCDTGLDKHAPQPA